MPAAGEGQQIGQRDAMHAPHDAGGLIVEREISNLLAEYCADFDAGDFDRFAEHFSHGTWFPTAAKGPGPGPVARWCRENILLYEGLPHTKHVSTNIWMDIDDAGIAQVHSYVTIWQGLPDFPLQAIFSGRYRDRIEMLEGRWRFRERWALPDIIGDMSRHVRNPLPPGPMRARE
jgi:hypothetical protein